MSIQKYTLTRHRCNVTLLVTGKSPIGALKERIASAQEARHHLASHGRWLPNIQGVVKAVQGHGIPGQDLRIFYLGN